MVVIHCNIYCSSIPERQKLQNDLYHSIIQLTIKTSSSKCILVSCKIMNHQTNITSQSPTLQHPLCRNQKQQEQSYRRLTSLLRCANEHQCIYLITSNPATEQKPSADAAIQPTCADKLHDNLSLIV